MHIRAHLRLDPDLAREPLVLTDGRGERSAVVATAAKADDVGIAVGMKISEARALCATLVVRQVSSEAVDAAIAALADVARTVSARVEIDGRERVFFDCEGSRLLWESESELASVVTARAERCGLPACVGIADSKLGAAVAAREGCGVRIVSPGETRAFLAPFPVAMLDPDPESAAILASWGIRSIANLAALPTAAFVHRLGPAGLRLVRRARGEDDAPLACCPMPQTFEEVLDLEYGIDRVEPLVFVLRRLIECVTRRIELYGLGCKELELGFELEGGGRDFRTIVAAASTTEHKVFVTLTRAELEARPLAQAAIKVAVAGMATRIAPTQLDLLRPAGPMPAALAAVVARLATLCGSDRVGVLRSADSHRPDAVELSKFDGIPARRVKTSVSSESPTTAPTVVRMALRALRPAVTLEVFENRGILDYVRGPGFGGRVVHWAGPWRLRGEWWTADPFAREYYDVELSDGGVYRLYRDARSASWFADGVYD